MTVPPIHPPDATASLHNMIPRREELVEPTPTTPLSPRVSDVSNESRYLRENDFLESPIRSPASVVSVWSEGKRPHGNGKLRHAVGIALLLATVFLWTASNFLASVRLPRDSRGCMVTNVHGRVLI